MNRAKELSLDSIIGSREGIHLTSYLENKGNVSEIKAQIKKTIKIGERYLLSVLKDEELKNFLAPLKQLLTDTRILKSFSSNIGLFRTRDSFRILGIPVPVEHLCVVATSFHVKPLLRWVQSDQELLMLGLERGLATLYSVTQSNIRYIDAMILPGSFPFEEGEKSRVNLNQDYLNLVKFEDSIRWLNNWIGEVTEFKKPPLFVAGDPTLIKTIVSELDYPNLRKNQIIWFYDRNKVVDSAFEARSFIKMETKKNMEKSIVEFFLAEELRLGIRNIFQIGKAAVKGKVRKLIVADGVHIFGKFNERTGGIVINPAHLDHEDDDLLDDLSQAVLARGGDVVVVPKEQLPRGRSIMAILRGESKKTVEIHKPTLITENRCYA